MAKGFKHGAGGGSGGLNFLVVGNPKPEKPKVNTLWVNTDDKITGYDFNITEPEAPIEGMVWVPTHTISPGSFNALKKNAIHVYPIGAMQYISGSWVNKPSEIYQDNAWVELYMYLYNHGDNNIELISGWTAVAKGYDSGAPAGTTPRVANSNGVMTIDFSTDEHGGMVYTQKKVDLTEYKYLCYDGSLVGTNGGSQFCGFGVWSSIGTYQMDNRKAWYGADFKDSIKRLDISSLSGLHHIGFYLFRGASKAIMRRMWLEK